jgi:hypothetical protein
MDKGIDDLDNAIETLNDNLVGFQNEYRIVFDDGSTGTTYSTCIPVVKASSRTITIHSFTGVGFSLSGLDTSKIVMQKFTSSIAFYCSDATAMNMLKGRLVAVSFTIS